MELDPADLDGYSLFQTMCGLLAPRPVAWISTVDETGTDNIAPYSFFSPISVEPPVVVFTAAPDPDGNVKDTAANALETEAFVVNLVTEETVEAMSDTAAHVDESEFDLVGLDRESSETVAPPRVAGVPGALECSLYDSLKIGETDVIFGEIEHIVIAEEYAEDGGVDATAIPFVGHLVEDDYTRMDHFVQEQPER